jgi:hypothetical protein
VNDYIIEDEDKHYTKLDHIAKLKHIEKETEER